jgi:hypothetical protein
MTGLDHDPLVAAFEEFRSRTAPYVKPAGADRTRESMRARKRNRNVAVSALSVLVVVIPLAAEAVLTGDPHDPPATTSSGVPRVTASMPYFVGPGETTHPSRTAPAGGITEAALYSAELDLPTWPAGEGADKCGTGPVRFEDGDTVVNDTNLWIAGVAYADVDGDGRAETFARVFCVSEIDAVSQVLAFTPTSGGGVHTIGPVLKQTGDVIAICGVRAGPNGAVQVETADFPVPWRCADPTLAAKRYVTRQWLTFTWNGSAFVQQGTATHTTNPYATDLSLTSTDLVLTKQANGHYVGSMTLTVHNTGSGAIPYKTETVISDGMRLTDPPPGCALDPSTAGGGMVDAVCTGATLAGGATRTVTLKVDSPRRYQLTYVADTNVIPLDGYNDPNQTNDRAPMTIKFRD